MLLLAILEARGIKDSSSSAHLDAFRGFPHFVRSEKLAIRSHPGCVVAEEAYDREAVEMFR